MSTKEKSQAAEVVAATVLAGGNMKENAGAYGRYTVVCIGADGVEKWRDEFPNLVVNSGLQLMNNTFFAGTTYTAVWYLGLITGPGSGTTFAAADTLASKAWTEFTNYAGSRKLVTFGTATTADPSVISNSASPSSFTISGAGGTVAGAFLSTVSSGTAGILFSESDFQSPGDRVVVSGDTLNVTYTFSLDAA